MEGIFEAIEAASGTRIVVVADRASGLRAFVAIDDTTLGPAAGGVRTMCYPTAALALADALALSRAMTLKCALAGLSAGGGKAVVLAHEGLDRRAAFTRLGQVIEELAGLFRTAGDLGTTAADLEVMAKVCRYVHTDERGLAAAVARGLCACVEACAEVRGVPVPGLRVLVQGAGSIGASAARAFVARGLEVLLCDLDAGRANDVAASIGPGVRVVAAEDALLAPVDILAPCAAGGVVTTNVAQGASAWALCGAANNALASADVASVLAARGILHVPDPIASAGAVIDGIGASVMGLSDRGALIDGLGRTASEVLASALSTGRTPMEVAELRARERIERARLSLPT